MNTAISKLKAKYPDALILMRTPPLLNSEIEDCYDVEGEDAKTVAKILNREWVMMMDTPYIGIPINQLEQVMPKLVMAGHKVAICDPLMFQEAKKSTEH